MSNFMYDEAKERILDGTIDLAADDIRVALVDATYSPNQSADEFLSTLSSAIVARSGALASKTFANGAFDAADTTVSAVTGAEVTQIVVFKHTGSDATARLILHFDTGVTGLPFTPSGADVPITWSNGASKIFRLTDS